MSDHHNEATATGSSHTGSIDTHRLEAFSDGVMAVIITIMAFDLKVPATADLHGLTGRVPELLVYVLSFTVIGIYWNNHHHLLRATERIGGAVMWTNLHLLFWLSLIPFVTEWVGTTHDRALPAATYGVVALGATLAYFALVRTILRANADDSALRAAVGRDTKGIISPIVFCAGVRARFRQPVRRLCLLRPGRAALVRAGPSTNTGQLNRARRCASASMQRRLDPRGSAFVSKLAQHDVEPEPLVVTEDLRGD